MAKYLGVDISYANANVDYDKLAKAKHKGLQVKFAILRTGFSLTEDRLFKRHYNGCKKAGIYMGVYHYSYAKTPTEAVAEADFVLKTIKGLAIDYPVYFDYEDKTLIDLKLTKAQYTAIHLAFLERIKQAGYYAAIYTNPDWYLNRLDSTKLKDYDLWLAHWTSEGKQRQLGQGMWQFAALGTAAEVGKGWATQVGSLDGSGGAIDVNYAYKGYAAIIRKAGLNKPTPQKYKITAIKTVTEAEKAAVVGELRGKGFGVTAEKAT